MKRDTRQAILDTAKALFSQRGYNAVSVGEIAGALGISKGNLTYYFKKKEEIVEAILDAAAPALPLCPPASLSELNDFFSGIQRAQEGAPFYFWSHAQLGQVSPKIREKQRAVYRRNQSLLTGAFQALADQGLLKPEAYPGQHLRTADTLLFTANYWLPSLVVKGERTPFLPQIWSVLFLQLTPAGRQGLAALGVELTLE